MFCVGNPQFANDPLLNRNLLLELYTEHTLCLANTFFEHPIDKLVTYRDLGVPPLSHCHYPNFAQIDFMLMPATHMDSILDIGSMREVHLQSQHFILVATLDVKLEKKERLRVEKQDVSALDGSAF